MFFVCGSLRSGSTLLGVMLDHHPKVRNPGEFDFLFDQVSSDGRLPDINQYHEWLGTHRIFGSKSLNIDNSLTYTDLVTSFINQLSQPDGLLALNVHRGFDRIPVLFPNTKFIHLIRDPRDVALSSIGMGWAGNVYYGVDHWLQTERSWERLQKKIPPGQYFEIKYEDLILTPEVVLKNLCSFVGVSYSVGMFNYVNKTTYSSPDPSLVRQWKSKLTRREVQYIESKANVLMQKLGYDLSGHDLISISLIERLWLKVNNKIFKLKFSVRKYGFTLYFKVKLSGLLGLSLINKEAKIAMNVVDRRYLK